MVGHHHLYSDTYTVQSKSPKQGSHTHATYDNTLSVYYEDNGSDSCYKIEMGPDFCVMCRIWE